MFPITKLVVFHSAKIDELGIPTEKPAMPWWFPAKIGFWFVEKIDSLGEVKAPVKPGWFEKGEPNFECCKNDAPQNGVASLNFQEFVFTIKA